DEEFAAVCTRISQRAGQIEPMLQQLHPKDWMAKGAPDTYVAQWTTIVDQFRAIQSDMSALTRQPGHLTDSMKALFRIQTNQQLLESLMGGVRKYQNPALADLIESVAAESSGDIDKFERHLLEMADEKEQQFTVVDREAQRCRATLSRQPAEPARANRKTQ
ncbi:MAG TPA: hypothetical protein VHC72_09725, partial [Bryobacteraceae bacterium]|nr:hypothetical protein [Bryobacteraceae bacterium]